MGITLSHVSALDATRAIRCKGSDLREMTTTKLLAPSVWRGERWRTGLFGEADWQWQTPSKRHHLHVLVDHNGSSIRMATIESHVQTRELPPNSIIWLDRHASMVCPELLFLQMAQVLSLPALVLLGYELCGNFSRAPIASQQSKAITHVPSATSVAQISTYLTSAVGVWGVKAARRALRYVSDHALSVPESILATMYALPLEEYGYGMGFISLNQRVRIGDENPDEHERKGSVAKSRFPDLMLSIAPIGINYDGEGHLDLDALIQAAQRVTTTKGDEHKEALVELMDVRDAIRTKYVDDIVRNRQLASEGRLVFPAMKEDLCSIQSLDDFTRDLLKCANLYFGVEIGAHLRALDDTESKLERENLLKQLQDGSKP